MIYLTYMFISNVPFMSILHEMLTKYVCTCFDMNDYHTCMCIDCKNIIILFLFNSYYCISKVVLSSRRRA